MEQKTIPADFLVKLELLPDGLATPDPQVWLQSWVAFTQKQVQQGKIKLYEIAEFDADTGQVPNEFIKQIYLKNRKLH